MKPLPTLAPPTAALAVAAFGMVVFGAAAADSPPKDRPYIPPEILARKTIIPDLPSGSVLPKDEAKRKDEGKFTPLAPDSAVSGYVDAPMLMRRPSTRPAPAIRVLPQTLEKREEAERKKNWIFVTPDSKAYTAESILGVRTKDDVNEAGEEREFKGSVQAFMEADDAKRNQTARVEKPDREADTSDVPINRRSETIDRSSTGGIGWVNEGGLFDRRGPAGMDASAAAAFMRGTGGGADFSTGFSLFGNAPANNTGAGGFTGAGAAREERGDNRKAWANDFNKLLNSTGGTSSPGRSTDPVGSFTDYGRQPINPVVGSLPGSSSAGSPFDAPKASGDPFGKSPGFGDPAPTIFGNSSLSPSLFAPPAQPLMAPKPGVLEIPKRKY